MHAGVGETLGPPRTASPGLVGRLFGPILAEVRRSESQAAWLFIAPALLHFAIFTGFPVVYGFYLSLHDWNMLSPRRTFVGLENYQELLSDPTFGESLLNTAYFSAGIVVATILFSFGLALVLDEPIRRITIFRGIFYSPAVTSVVAIGVVWFWMLDPEYGLINQALRGLGIYGQLDTWNDYGTGKVGSVNLYPAWLSNIKTFPFQTVTAQMPKRKATGSQFAGNYWTMPATNVANGKLEAFARFVEWWSRPGNNARWCRDTGALPTSQATIDSEIYKKFLQDEPNARAYVDSIPYARPFPGVVGVTGVLQIVAEAWEASVLGKSSPKEALDRAEKRAADELKRAQRA